MTDDDGRAAHRLAAGEYASWLRGMQEALEGDQVSDVPCDGCTACCTSGQFVHIEPDETDTLSHIPAELLFPAPLRPRGHVLLGYDERGHCPMLVDGACSIYEHRPRACRTYDCRIFSATGIAVDDGKDELAARVRRWEFTFPSEEDRVRHDAVAAATAFLRAHRNDPTLPRGAVPVNGAQLAALAVSLHALFVSPQSPDDEVVRAELISRWQSR